MSGFMFGVLIIVPAIGWRPDLLDPPAGWWRVSRLRALWRALRQGDHRL